LAKVNLIFGFLLKTNLDPSKEKFLKMPQSVTYDTKTNHATVDYLFIEKNILKKLKD